MWNLVPCKVLVRQPKDKVVPVLNYAMHYLHLHVHTFFVTKSRWVPSLT